MFCFLHPVSALTHVLDPISVQSAFERAGIIGNTLTSDDPHVAIRPSVLLKRCPGVADLNEPVSLPKRKSLEGTVLNDTPSRKIVRTFKKGTAQGDSSKTAVLLNHAQSLTAREQADNEMRKPHSLLPWYTSPLVSESISARPPSPELGPGRTSIDVDETAEKRRLEFQLKLKRHVEKRRWRKRMMKEHVDADVDVPAVSNSLLILLYKTYYCLWQPRCLTVFNPNIPIQWHPTLYRRNARRKPISGFQRSLSWQPKDQCKNYLSKSLLWVLLSVICSRPLPSSAPCCIPAQAWQRLFCSPPEPTRGTLLCSLKKGRRKLQ